MMRSCDSVRPADKHRLVWFQGRPQRRDLECGGPVWNDGLCLCCGKQHAIYSLTAVRPGPMGRGTL